MRDDLQVMIDLPMLVRHGRTKPPIAIQNFQAAQPIARAAVEDARRFFVVFFRRSFCLRRFVIHQSRAAFFAGNELPIARRGAKHRTAEHAGELFAQPDADFYHREIPRHVARGMPQRE